jgi:hypothetical protein
MNTTITPFFELDGKRYEIKRTRYLLAEYEKLSGESKLSDEDKKNAIKAQSLIADIQRYGQKVQELWEIFEETFDDEAERKYLKAKALYENALEALAKLEVESGCTTKLQKEGIDLLERIAILGLAEQYFAMDYEKAEELWVRFVEDLGKSNVTEWLSAMAECLFNDENEAEENPFLSKMRARAKAKSRKS